MSKKITKKRSAPKPAPRGGKNLTPTSEEERLLEVRARLRMEADEARRKYVREMVMTGAAVFVIVNACALSAFLIYSPPVSGDRQAGIILFSNVVGLVLGAAYGKTVSRLKG
jgi:small-conductance mechanosensitive channel